MVLALHNLSGDVDLTVQDQRLDKYVDLGKARLTTNAAALETYAKQICSFERAQEIASEFQLVIDARNTAVHGHHGAENEGFIVRSLKPGRQRNVHSILCSAQELDRWAARAGKLSEEVAELQFAKP